MNPAKPPMRSSPPPLVSVLMPAYNHDAFVEKAVRSVLDQHYPNIELIAIDDGSTDETPSILDRLSAELGFTFLRNNRNIGVNATLERAMVQSRGEFLSVLASDDLILPAKIARQVEYIEAHELDGVYSNGFLLTSDGRRIPINLDEARKRADSGTLLQLAYYDDTKLPLLQSGLFRRDALLAMAPYRRQFQSDDWVVLIKLLENYRIGFLDERLFVYRQHEANTFRRYWQTLPMRLEVVAKVTPEPLRARAMATILESHAKALMSDGRSGLGSRFWLASLVFNPSPTSVMSWAKMRVGSVCRNILRQRDRHV